MTVAIYCRVSTDEQAEKGFSLDAQKERLIAYCASQGWEDYKLYIDDGYTGTNMNRPALKRMLRHIDEKKIDTVIVYKLDRLGRKQKDVLYLLEDVFEKHDVVFKSATEPFDTSTSFGKAMIGILAVFAQLERDMIVERTTSGRRQKVSQGMWYGGRIPFGYSWNKEAKMLEIVPEEAHLIKEVFKRYLQGQPRLAIAEWLTDRTKARVIDHAVIRDILARPIYMGKLINGEAIVDGNHEAIIDEDVWYSAQKEARLRYEGSTPLGDYLLTGLLTCGVCGSGIVHVKRKTSKRGKVYLYELYACKNQHVRAKDRTNNCSLGYSRREKIEKYVVDQIKALGTKPKKIKEMISKKNDFDSNTDISITIDALKSKIQKTQEGLDNLYDAIQSGEIKASALGSRIKKLEEEREALERQLDEMIEQSPLQQSSSSPENVYFLFRDIGQGWDYLTFDEQKIMVRKVIESIKLIKDGDPEIMWKLR